MKKHLYILALAAAISACATIGPNATLDEAKAFVDETQAIAGIDNVAASNMEDARQELQQATSLHASGGKLRDVEHHALLARKHSEIARQRLAIVETQRQLDRAERDRQELLIAARERRARQAESEALVARTEAEDAAREARAAREEARLALEEAEAARAKAALAQQQLNQAQADALALALEIDELKARESERGIVLTLEDIVFAFDSAALQPGGERAVVKIAEFLNRYSSRQVLIEGHTDSVGSSEYNETLSAKRAASVKDALLAQGVADTRVSTRGLGEDYPVASNDSDAGRQANRRVELIVANQDDAAVEQREE